MLDLLNITGPIYLLSVLGYVAVRFRWMTPDGVRALATFFITFAVPAALFSAISRQSIKDIIQLDFLLVYGPASLGVFTGVFLISRFVLKREISACAIYAMGGCFSNSIMISYPLMTTLYPTEGILIFANALLVENILLMPLTLLLAEMGHSSETHKLKVLRNAFLSMSKSPIIHAIVLGIAFASIGLQVPHVFSSVIDMLARTTAGIGLFVIGGFLCGFKMSGSKGPISLVVAAKIVCHPLLVFTLLYATGIENPAIILCSLILAASPMFSALVSIGSKYGHGDVAAGALLPATILSFFTITTLLWVFDAQF